jgi:glycosyltransferase involved in cell wall biosynthesis
VRLALFADTWTPQVNGVARTLDRLVHALEARGGAVQVFAPADPDAAADGRVQRASSRPFWAYPQLRLAWPSAGRVHAMLRTFDPTLVHIATEFGVGLAGRRAAHALRVPHVSSYHTNFTAYAAHYKLGALASAGWHYLRWFHRTARRTYCPTHAVADDLAARGFGHCAVWSRGVDPVRFNPSFRSAEVRVRCGANDETLLVAWVGRLGAEKGLGDALDAVRIAEQARPGHVRMVVVGDGPHDAEMRARAPRCATFTGRLEGAALSAVYASADVFAFPSTTDTFGNVLLEAMASGLPVIGADVGPTRELLADDRGWLVRPHDVNAFASRLVRLVGDRLALQRARRAALSFAATCTWDRVWDRLFSDYAEFAQRPSR